MFKTCDTKPLCQWNGSFCDAKSTPLSTNEKESIKLNFQKALGKTMIVPEAGNGYERSGVNYAANALGAGYGKICPVETPWCERSACSSPYTSDLNTDSEACFRQPGCCFDSTLFIYRNIVGDYFAEGVPVCYKAISNPIFHEKVTTGYDHNSIDGIVNEILVDFKSNNGKKETLQKMGCAPGDDDQFGRIGLIHVLTRGNYRFRNAISTIDGFHEFVDFVSPLCGWTGISANQCFLIGCCWNEKTERCGGSLEKIYSGRIEAFLTALDTKNDFKDESCTRTSEQTYVQTSTPAPVTTTSTQQSLETESMITPGPAPFMIHGPPQIGININNHFGRKRRSYFGQSYSGAHQIQPSFPAHSTCLSRDVSSRCMDSCATDVFNYAKKPHMEALCKAKGCCFDNTTYDQITADKDHVMKNCPFASYASGLYEIVGYPSIKDFAKGCCDVSLCLNNQPTNTQQIVKPQPEQWTAWTAWSTCTFVNNLPKRTRTRQSNFKKTETGYGDCNQQMHWNRPASTINIFNG